MNLRTVGRSMEEKIIVIFLCFCCFWDEGLQVFLNLPAAGRPLVSLRSTALSSTCLRHPTCLRQVDGGAALPRSELRFLRQSTTSRLCLLRRLFKVKVARRCLALCHLCKGGRNFLFALVCSASLWLFCPRLGCYLSSSLPPFFKNDSTRYRGRALTSLYIFPIYPPTTPRHSICSPPSSQIEHTIAVHPDTVSPMK